MPRSALRSPRGAAALRTAAAVAALLLPACHRAAVATGAPAPDEPRLAALYADDQRDRQAVTPEGGVAPLRAQAARDSTRRAQVLALMARGAARTAADYHHAAIVMQHGTDSASYRLAWEWASRAVTLDPSRTDARWLSAAAWDRWQLSLGKPQWYGTQIVKARVDAPWRIAAIDTTRVSDADRARLGVRPLAEQRARVDSLNRAGGY